MSFPWNLFHNRLGMSQDRPSGLKPAIFLFLIGTAEAVPIQNQFMKQLLGDSEAVTIEWPVGHHIGKEFGSSWGRIVCSIQNDPSV
jgi:hypothetical protein